MYMFSMEPRSVKNQEQLQVHVTDMIYNKNIIVSFETLPQDHLQGMFPW